MEHQVIRHKVAEISSRIDAVEAYANQICWAINQGCMPVAQISKCKFFTSKQMEYVASEAMQILGAKSVKECYEAEPATPCRLADGFVSLSDNLAL